METSAQRELGEPLIAPSSHYDNPGYRPPAPATGSYKASVSDRHHVSISVPEASSAVVDGVGANEGWTIVRRPGGGGYTGHQGPVGTCGRPGGGPYLCGSLVWRAALLDGTDHIHQQELLCQTQRPRHPHACPNSKPERCGRVHLRALRHPALPGLPSPTLSAADWYSLSLSLHLS